MNKVEVYECPVCNTLHRTEKGVQGCMKLHKKAEDKRIEALEQKKAEQEIRNIPAREAESLEQFLDMVLELQHKVPHLIEEGHVTRYKIIRQPWRWGVGEVGLDVKFWYKNKKRNGWFSPSTVFDFFVGFKSGSGSGNGQDEMSYQCYFDISVIDKMREKMQQELDNKEKLSAFIQHVKEENNKAFYNNPHIVELNAKIKALNTELNRLRNEMYIIPTENKINEEKLKYTWQYIDAPY